MSNQQVLRIGKISTLNCSAGTARVTYEDRDSATTKELPFLAWTYWMPKVGDRVLVGHLTNGSTSAVILGPVWAEEHKPAAAGADLFRQEMSTTAGQAYAEYSNKSGILHLRAEHIELDSYGDGADTTVAALLSRISALESRCSAHGI
jgi:phage baseplate assembly protein gpV